MLHKQLFQKHSLVSILAVSVSCLTVSPTQARNAFFPQGLGSQFTLAGAGTALPIEPTNVDANPAVLTRLDTQVSAYMANYFQHQSLDTSNTHTPPVFITGNPIGKQVNRLKNAPGGTFGVNYVLNHKWAMGLGTSGGSSMVKYNAPTLNPAFLNFPANYNNQLVNTVVLLNPTVSYAHGPCDTYGFSLIVGYQTLKTNLAVPGQVPPFPQTSGGLRKDSATGIGARIGGLWDLNKNLSLGASASTPVKFKKFNKYKDALPRSFDIPAIFRAGLAFHAGNTDYLFDIKQIYFAKVRSLGDSLGWKNSTILMLGIQHKLAQCLILSGGYSYGNSPVRSNNVMINGLIVPIARQHFTLGARYKFLKHWELSAGASFSPNVQMVDDGTGIMSTVARGAVLKSREVGAILGVVYHL